MDIMELVVPAAIGAAGTLLGVAVTSRYTFRLAQLNHALSQVGSERKRLERIAQLLEHWSEAMNIQIPFFKGASMSDLIEFVDTDSGRQHREFAEELKNLLISGKLNSEDRDIRAAYSKLHETWTTFTSEAIAPLTDKKQNHPVLQSIRSLDRFQQEFRKQINDINDLIGRAKPGVMAWAASLPRRIGSLWQRLRWRTRIRRGSA